MAVNIVNALHGDLLRLITDKTGQHYQGLSAAARASKQCFTPKQRRKIRELDVCASILRHITVPSSKAFYKEIATALGTACDANLMHLDIAEAATGENVAAIKEPHTILENQEPAPESSMLQTSMLLVIQEQKMMELSSKIANLEDKLTKFGESKYSPLPTLVAMRKDSTVSYPGAASSSKSPELGLDTAGVGGICTAQDVRVAVSYPGVASFSQSPAIWPEMRIDIAGDGGIYTEQDFRDYYQDNFARMWNAAEPIPMR